MSEPDLSLALCSKGAVGCTQRAGNFVCQIAGFLGVAHSTRVAPLKFAILLVVQLAPSHGRRPAPPSHGPSSCKTSRFVQSLIADKCERPVAASPLGLDLAQCLHTTTSAFFVLACVRFSLDPRPYGEDSPLPLVFG